MKRGSVSSSWHQTTLCVHLPVSTPVTKTRNSFFSLRVMFDCARNRTHVQTFRGTIKFNARTEQHLMRRTLGRASSRARRLSTYTPFLLSSFILFFLSVVFPFLLSFLFLFFFSSFLPNLLTILQVGGLLPPCPTLQAPAS